MRWIASQHDIDYGKHMNGKQARMCMVDTLTHSHSFTYRIKAIANSIEISCQLSSSQSKLINYFNEFH